MYGVQRIIEKNYDSARQIADMLNSIPYATILNEIHLNQVLCRLEPEDVEDLDSFHHNLTKKIQVEGSCWLGTSIWNGMTVLRMSLTNLYTSSEDIQITYKAIKRAISQELKQRNEINY